MPVTIRIFGQEAQFHQGQWHCEDDGVLAMLDALADPRAQTPNAEEEHAFYCAGRFGGSVWVGSEWKMAELPEPELKLDAYALPSPKPERGGWLPWSRKKR
ncbi:hypothetical protein EHF33_01015 [Deinococcus psychrotolerans]|uniref:Uncharacterized protein n=2 Tax=Deinococcus TaxID=1298 RepID=A0A553V318_9DEIO|nr:MULTISPECIES: hypothetical protein [Deinococcus]AZI41510.1 hypothetical protein EHF33_01015 [Deinococcus psychrotolerans]TSA86822.1 hypothetical protein FNU79_06450 [Deinococcus detaillensis]